MRSVNRPALILAVFLSTFLSIGFSADTLRAAEVARIPWFSKGAFLPGPSTEIRWIFPKVDENRRLDVQFVSCGIREPGSAVDPYSAFLGVNNALSLSTRRHLLPWIRYTYPEGSINAFSYDISQPIVMSFYEGERPQVGFVYAGTGGATWIPARSPASSSSCSSRPAIRLFPFVNSGRSSCPHFACTQ